MSVPTFGQLSTVEINDVTTKTYKPDGGYQVDGLALTIAAGAVAGLLAGVAFGLLSQWFYMILVFPLVIGLIVGSAQKVVIQWTKVRNTLAGGAAGLIAGLFTVVTMHYVDYEVFKREQAKDEATVEEFRELVRQGEYTLAEYEEAKREYDADPGVIAARSIDSFFKYVDVAAQQGVELFGSTSTSKGVNLGYVGTYIYWCADALMIVAMVVFVTRKQAAEPFCVECDRWKDSVELGRLPVNAKQAGVLFDAGHLSALPRMSVDAKSSTVISAFVCSQCQQSEQVVIQVSNVVCANGSEDLVEIGRYVSDETAVEEISKLFDALAEPNPADEEAAQLLAAAKEVYAEV